MFSCFEVILIAVLGAQLVLQLVPLFFVAWLTWRLAHFCSEFSRAFGGIRRHIGEVCRPAYRSRAMDCDELIDELLSECDGAPAAAPGAATPSAQAPGPPSQSDTRRRERLAALVAGGQARQYLGKAFTVDQIDALDDAEIEKLYARYEARLGAAMTKSLGSAALQLYAWGASIFLPIPVENQPALIADLQDEPFVGQALSSAACELYHRYGMFIAPLTAALTTMKHCQFGHHCPVRIVGQSQSDNNDDGDDGIPSATERASRA